MTQRNERQHEDGITTTRRVVLLSAGAAGAAGLLAACGGGDSGGTSQGTPITQPPGTTAPGTTAPGTTVPGTTAPGTTAPGAPSGREFNASDIPVGGGKIDGRIVVTQPTAGTFKAFDSTCTHMGCTVGSVAAGRIRCPCHGSQFNATTGAVVNGPATEGLAAKAVTVQGSKIIVS